MAPEHAIVNRWKMDTKRLSPSENYLGEVTAQNIGRIGRIG